MLVKYLDSLEQPYFKIELLPSWLVDHVPNASGERAQKQMRKVLITDPTTNQVFVELRNPKIPISGFQNPPANCVDLLNMMQLDSVDLVDFGFDDTEYKIIDDERDPWAYMCDIMKPKYKQIPLWSSID